MKKLSPVSIDDTNSHCSVPCFAHFVVPPRAAYLKSAQEVDATGAAYFAFPRAFHEAIENLNYQEWERHVHGNGYKLSHEAVFTTLDSVNRRHGESLDILVQASDDTSFLAHGSASYEQSITAFAFATNPQGAGGSVGSKTTCCLAPLRNGRATHGQDGLLFPPDEDSGENGRDY